MAAPQFKVSYQYSTSACRKKHMRQGIVPSKVVKRRVVKKKSNPLAILVKVAFACLFCYLVVPFYMDNVTRPAVLKTNKYPLVTTDYNLLAHPTRAYLFNNNVI